MIGISAGDESNKTEIMIFMRFFPHLVLLGILKTDTTVVGYRY